MKKIIYIVLLSLCASLAFSSCTEEPVTPTKLDTGGAGASGGRL